jgi:pyridoxamine 5'-phosphate oxidase
VSLDAVLEDALHRLAAGVSDPRSPFRTLTLASVDAAGAPDQRTLVLRAFDPAARQLSLHTDNRSAKIAHLQRQPAVSLHVWDGEERLQVRIAGNATLHVGDDVARAAWEALPGLNRQLYRLRQSPGTPLADPSPLHYDEYPEAMGFAAFAVLAVAFNRLESLRLSGQGQLRARFDWSGDGRSSAWLVP